MGRKPEYTAEQKVWASEQYLSGSKSAAEIAISLNMPESGGRAVYQWSRLYKVNGSSIFYQQTSQQFLFSGVQRTGLQGISFV